jgi:Ala-tRNA(Pro) deacylase
VDCAIYAYEKILITPGVPEFTIELSTEELKKILLTCPNTVLEYKQKESL